MKRIVVPTSSPEDWRRLLAEPAKHWREGYSAMTLAQSWESAHPSVPPEVAAALDSTRDPRLANLRLILAIPEYQVDLPGGGRPSQTDVLAIMRGSEGLVVMAVEGKVAESFGPTVGEKRTGASPGVEKRLAWLSDLLGIDPCPDAVRYQLLHRTASAILAAQEFDASAAVMLVHSFSPESAWFDDYAAFCGLLKAPAAQGTVAFVGEVEGMPLFIGWCAGDQKFRGRV